MRLWLAETYEKSVRRRVVEIYSDRRTFVWKWQWILRRSCCSDWVEWGAKHQDGLFDGSFTASKAVCPINYANMLYCEAWRYRRVCTSEGRMLEIAAWGMDMRRARIANSASHITSASTDYVSRKTSWRLSIHRIGWEKYFCDGMWVW